MKPSPAPQGDIAPNPTPVELRLKAAGRAFGAAADAVERHEGERTGPVFAAKVAAWRDASKELLAAGRALPKE